VEADQGGPDRGPAGTQQTGEISLDQPLVGLELPPHDGFTKQSVGLDVRLDRADSILVRWTASIPSR
jgi:hypothetical protein